MEGTRTTALTSRPASRMWSTLASRGMHRNEPCRIPFPEIHLDNPRHVWRGGAELASSRPSFPTLKPQSLEGVEVSLYAGI